MSNTIYRIVASLVIFFAAPNVGIARISIDPYVTVSSQKTIKPDKVGATSTAKTETSTTKQRTTYGIKASLGLTKALKVQVGVGTNSLTTTSKSSEIVDEYGEIDLKKELSVDTSTPTRDVKVTETQKKANATVIVDPSFGPLILRAKAGVVATQRALKKEEDGATTKDYLSPITYKPTAGAGAGIKLSSRTQFVAEYSFYFYKFPDTKKFEREVTINFGVSL